MQGNTFLLQYGPLQEQVNYLTKFSGKINLDHLKSHDQPIVNGNHCYLKNVC